jgi:hypothetical protein
MSQDSTYQFPNTILFGTGDDPSGSGGTGDDPSGSGGEGNKRVGKSKGSKKKPTAKKK